MASVRFSSWCRRLVRPEVFTQFCFVLGGCDVEPELMSEASAGDPIAVVDPLPAARCGDGRLHGDEECDEGEANGAGGCDIDCRISEHRNRREPVMPEEPVAPDGGLCGDGQISASEICDDGRSANAWTAGACAPDCRARIGVREIRSSERLRSGDLGEDPVGRVDAACAPGFRALFSDGSARLPPRVDAPRGRDWVLAPYTAYVRPDGELVWTTGAQALLGIREGAAASLRAPLLECEEGRCPHVLTGLSQHWEPLYDRDCYGWTAGDVGQATLGEGGARDTFLLSQQAHPCDFAALDVVAYCVED